MELWSVLKISLLHSLWKFTWCHHHTCLLCSINIVQQPMKQSLFFSGIQVGYSTGSLIENTSIVIQLAALNNFFHLLFLSLWCLKSSTLSNARSCSNIFFDNWSLNICHSTPGVFKNLFAVTVSWTCLRTYKQPINQNRHKKVIHGRMLSAVGVILINSDMHGIHSYLMNDKTKSVGWHANILQTLGFACDAFWV